MINGHGRSDSAIVAERPTNKAGQLAAEPGERRAETKGNAAQQSTRRAQNRESVSQALDRIRQVASQRTKEKFTTLLHHVSLEYLEAALFQLKENAAPGVDGLTWQDLHGRPPQGTCILRSAEEPDHRHRRLLRARCEWPCGCPAAEQRYERAPVDLRAQSINSSASCCR
jgi:hypothetical protein